MSTEVRVGMFPIRPCGWVGYVFREVPQNISNSWPLANNGRYYKQVNTTPRRIVHSACLGSLAGRNPSMGYAK